MRKGGIGGGNTKTGLTYEGKVDLEVFLNKQTGYTVKDGEVYFKGERIASIFKKNGFYTFLKKEGVDWKKIVSKRILPDQCIMVVVKNTVYIIEIKYQQVAGSVDEKLQTCDFKLKQFRKLLASLNLKVEYIYLLNDWFLQESYKDVLDYIIDVGCSYYFNYIPLDVLGLPLPSQK